MLGGVRDTEWSILVMDGVTTKVMSSVCRISEILDYGVSCEPANIALLPLPAETSMLGERSFTQL
jgi:hypothetical protein